MCASAVCVCLFFLPIGLEGLLCWCDFAGFAEGWLVQVALVWGCVSFLGQQKKVAGKKSSFCF